MANNCVWPCTCRHGTPTSSVTWPTPISIRRGHWRGGDRYQQLIEAVENVPEQVTIFSDAMEFMEREIDRRDMALREQELLFQLEEAEKANEPLPLQDLLSVPLYPYQIRGAIFAACRGRCILGDDMGLGKTIQTMAAIELLARERGIERVLVVAPASVKYQWQTEIQKFTGRPVQVIEGTTAQRRAQYKAPTFYRLTNYETAVRDLDELNAWQPDLIVLDEAQRIKNWESKTTRAIKQLAQPVCHRADRHAAGEQARGAVQHRAVRR